MMTFDEVADFIAKMTPAQRKRPVGILMQNTGELAGVKSIIPVEDANGMEIPDQFVIWYDNRTDFPEQ